MGEHGMNVPFAESKDFSPGIGLLKRINQWAGYLAWTVIVIAILVWVGWQFNIELLKRPIPRLVAMNPVSALAFILSGISFLLLTSKTKYKQKLIGGKILAFLVLIIGLIRISTKILGWTFSVDTVLYYQKLSGDLIANVSNRMAINTASCFILTGISLLLLNFETRKKNMPSQAIAVIIILLSLFSIVGYLYQVKAFYGVLANIPMAIHTAACFLLFSIAILFANPGKGIMKELTSPFSGSIVARFLFPAAIIIPVVLGFLRLWAAWSANIPFELGTALQILTNVMIFLLLSWFIIVSLNKRDKLKQEAEEKVRESQVMFSSLFHKSPVMNTITEIHNGKFIEVNNAFADFMGYTKNELIGKTSNELNVLVNPKEREQVVMNIEEDSYVRGREMQIAIKNGKIRWLSVNVDKMNLNGKDCLLTAAIDISSRKEAEQLVQKQKQDIQDFIDSMSTLCAKVTTDGKIIIVNKTALLATGLAIEELLNTNFLEGKWWTFDADVHSRISNAFEKACSGVAVTYDENIFVFNQVLTINFSLIPIFRSNSEVDYIVAEGRDITALKTTETALTEKTNQLVALNSELEAFSYSVSHDLRAPLRGIIGFSSILEEDYGSVLDEEGKRITSVIKSNTIKMGQLIDDLLAFSRMGRQDILKTNIDTRMMVDEVIEALVPNGKVKEIDWVIHSLPKVNGDMNTIRQVWINLISNAIKYSGNKERQRIEIGFSDRGRQFVFYVKDNGVGFDEQYNDKLFKVFQRLHSAEEFEGTGIGLALVEKIISKHGGKVWAEGKNNEGACFYFSLPA